MSSFTVFVPDKRLVLACLALSLFVAPLAAADDTLKSHSASLGLAGKWERHVEIDRALGYTDGDESQRKKAVVFPCSYIEITIDKTLGDSTPEGELESYREYVEQQEHQLVATGRIRRRHGEDDVSESECLITHRKGKTYFWYGAVNIGLLTARVSIVPGAKQTHDLLFVDFDPLRDFYSNARKSYSVAAYKRTRK